MRTGKMALMVGGQEGFEIKEYPLISPTAGNLLVEITRAGVCGSEVHQWRRIRKTGEQTRPHVVGHEVIGRIYELGDGVTIDAMGEPIGVGDRVMAKFMVSCGYCYFCRTGDETLCQNRSATLPPGSKSHEDPPHFVGGYAEYLHVRAGMSFFKLPESLTDDEVAAFICAGPVLLHALDHDPIHPPETVVVQGTGPIGLYATMITKLSGASLVINVGGPGHRLEMAQRLGADHVIDVFEEPDRQKRVQQVLDLTDGIGPDVVLECTGVPAAFPEGVDTVRKGGRYFVIGLLSPGLGCIEFVPSMLAHKEIRIQGSNATLPINSHNYLRSLLTAKERYPIGEVVSHRYPLERASEALDAVASGEAVRAVFVP